MTRNKIISSLVLVSFIVIIVALVILNTRQVGGEIMMTSLSSDGHYAITTDDKDYAILWDLKKHTKKILSRDADAYSAYWIKGASYYMWQNWKTKHDYITDAVSGKNRQTLFLKFIVFGQAMSADLQYFAASDKHWNILSNSGDDLKFLVTGYNNSPGFYNKLINFTFLGNDKLLTSGFGDYDSTDLKNSVGINLWDLKTRKPIQRFLGNQVQTFATISPDGKYVVSGDNNFRQFVWDLKTGNKIVSVFGGQPWTGTTKSGNFLTDKNVVSPPSDDYSSAVLTVEYIDNNHYLVFNHNEHYATLYQTLNPKPLKYLDLGNAPYPSTDALERDQSIDSSPSAHILVTGKRDGPGIMVYHYNPKTQTLKKIWDSQ